MRENNVVSMADFLAKTKLNDKSKDSLGLPVNPLVENPLLEVLSKTLRDNVFSISSLLNRNESVVENILDNEVIDHIPRVYKPFVDQIESVYPRDKPIDISFLCEHILPQVDRVFQDVNDRGYLLRYLSSREIKVDFLEYFDIDNLDWEVHNLYPVWFCKYIPEDYLWDHDLEIYEYTPIFSVDDEFWLLYNDLVIENASISLFSLPNSKNLIFDYSVDNKIHRTYDGRYLSKDLKPVVIKLNNWHVLDLYDWDYKIKWDYSWDKVDVYFADIVFLFSLDLNNMKQIEVRN